MAETDPLIEHNDDDDEDDDDNGNTNPFQSSSTPGPSGEEFPMTTMN